MRPPFPRRKRSATESLRQILKMTTPVTGREHATPLDERTYSPVPAASLSSVGAMSLGASKALGHSEKDNSRSKQMSLPHAEEREPK